MRNLFLEHPKSLKETYFVHLKHSFYLSYTLIKISAISFVHGLFPFLFVTTTSDMVEKLSKDLVKRRNRSTKGMLK
ncbi:DUF6356 family protein [Candidatus Tisiphia endosymbiont of Oplodontha viridula]|uniref:DUF6356 family protein n=1 Tax=Candidatus Tisiphia endosymbiont of Oplodontha viridula TaxID=3077925 RepID=UPI0035C8E79F